ncbi:MAG: HAD-IA family hydrolase [Chlorobaculum sp.]|jgi:phosphoglycolate phosphatase|nr:HAD-IA family hydrolase [Chlorobaculum sp.]
MNQSVTPKFSAVVFDMDGTLLNTLADISFSLNSVLAEEGYPTHTVDECRVMIGFGMRELVRKALPESAHDDSVTEPLLKKMQARYAEHWNDNSRPYDGMAALLDAIDRLGLKKAILSNKPDRFTRQCAEELLAPWRFDVIMGFREGIAPKPDPTGALMVAEELGVQPASILYVGDSGVDMKTANAAGMYPLGVTWGFRPAAELLATGAAQLVSSPEAIIPLLTV